MLLPIADLALQKDVPDPIKKLTDPELWQRLLGAAGAWAVVVLVAFLANFIAKRVIVRGLRQLAAKTQNKWDDVLVEHRVFERLSQLAPALVVYVAAPIVLDEPEQAIYADYLRRLANVWMIIAGARVVHTLLDSLVVIGRGEVAWRSKPLRSYAQAVQIVLWIAAGILSVAVLMQKSPSALLASLGAMTAVLMLVFRDTILGFIASIRIESNDMVRLGDWVEMPKYGADGDVIDIGVHTVKVQNWDKTITTIPTHALMSDSFKNWRGMTESGGRRIKRSLVIDVSSVRFLTSEDIESLRRIQSLREYLDRAKESIHSWNADRGFEETNTVDGRKLTNLGTFRKYVDTYLRAIPELREDMTFLVRQLAPTSQGVPIQIYCFSGEQRWAFYEGIMADIFDHLLAVVREFDLRVYQEPTSMDVRSIAEAQEFTAAELHRAAEAADRS